LILCLLALPACSDDAVRPIPPDCATRRAAVVLAEVIVSETTKHARDAIGEEAATLAWWKVYEAEAALEEARKDARGCP
jgi:hypothetical protein